MAKKKVTKAAMPMQRTLLRKLKTRKAPIIMDGDKNFHVCDVKKYK